jgi:hypothetical protein
MIGREAYRLAFGCEPPAWYTPVTLRWVTTADELAADISEDRKRDEIQLFGGMRRPWYMPRGLIIHLRPKITP